MKLSDDFYNLLNSIENFNKLPHNHPDVIKVRELVERELIISEEERKKVEELEKGDLLYNIDRTNLTPTMFHYLIQHGVTSDQLVKHLKVSATSYADWKTSKQLTKDDLYVYTVTDEQDSDLFLTFRNAEQTAEYIGVVKATIYRAIATGSAILGRYYVEKEAAENPTLEEAQTFEEKETFGYWLENTDNKARRKVMV